MLPSGQYQRITHIFLVCSTNTSKPLYGSCQLMSQSFHLAMCNMHELLACKLGEGMPTLPATYHTCSKTLTHLYDAANCLVETLALPVFSWIILILSLYKYSLSYVPRLDTDSVTSLKADKLIDMIMCKDEERVG